jgi:hypothetical protein
MFGAFGKGLKTSVTFVSKASLKGLRETELAKRWSR